SGRASELEHVHTGHFGVHFLEGTGFDQRMDALASTDAKMMLALGADLEVFVQFLVENHGAAFGVRALGPETLRDFAFARFAARQLVLFGKSRVRVGWGWSDGRFAAIQAEGFF